MAIVLLVVFLFWGLTWGQPMCCCCPRAHPAASLQLQLQKVWETLEGCPQGSDGLPHQLLQSAAIIFHKLGNRRHIQLLGRVMQDGRMTLGLCLEMHARRIECGAIQELLERRNMPLQGRPPP